MHLCVVLHIHRHALLERAGDAGDSGGGVMGEDLSPCSWCLGLHLVQSPLSL